MWRIPLLWSWSIDSLFLPNSPGLPNKWYQSRGSAWCGSGSGSWYLINYRMWKLTLGRRMLGFKCE
ncbi:hypothetical protein A2U01_0082782 [Trifolium medium]|uniref:Uncharacterized protein n=1 Tax=Trifolium medium TaxID=97028 RepID=A0A392TNR0_9FABA|nr:hypothetical protein [Trifolium medium]